MGRRDQSAMDALNLRAVELLDEACCSALEADLVDCIATFNAEATGHVDARLLGGRIRAASGELVGAFSGHTWGRVCVVSHLWVAEGCRGSGLGRALLTSAEAEARRRRCTHAILTTHSFQAPRFYERAGYRCVAHIEGWPTGHSNLVYRKQLDGEVVDRS